MLEHTVLVRVGEEDIEACSLGPVAQTLESTMDQGAAADLFGRLALDIEGYEEDAVNLASQPEVVRWFMTLDETYPFLMYFLSKEEYPRFCAMFVPAMPERQALRFDHSELTIFITRRANKIAEFCASVGLDSRGCLSDLGAFFNIDLPVEDIAAEYEASLTGEQLPLGTGVAEDPPSPGQAGFPEHWPFTPQKLASPLLQETFAHANIWPLRDISDEPVLFAAVDDPLAAYEAPMEINLVLQETQHFPLILLYLYVHDNPDEPLLLTFPLNIDDDDHRRWLAKLGELTSLMTNILFRVEGGDLYWAYTVPIVISDLLAEKCRTMLAEAEARLEMIPQEYRDFNAAINDYRELLEKDKELDQAHREADGQEDIPAEDTPEEPSEALPETLAPQAEEDTPAEDGAHYIAETAEAEATMEQVTVQEDTPADMDAVESLYPEDVTIDADMVPDDSMTDVPPTGQVKTPYDKNDSVVLPEQIQRIERALSQPAIKPEVPVTERLAIAPAKVKKIARPTGSAPGDAANCVDDAVERLSRKLIILESRLEQKIRENKKLKQENEALQNMLNESERDHLLLEKPSWWRRRRKPAGDQDID